MHTGLLVPKSLSTFYQIINKPDFPSLADEIAEPRPDKNIKVNAFTVREKSINKHAHDGQYCYRQIINSLHAGKCACFLLSADFFLNQNLLFLNILSGILSEFQTFLIQIRPTKCQETICKSYQQTTLVGKELDCAS